MTFQTFFLFFILILYHASHSWPPFWAGEIIFVLFYGAKNISKFFGVDKRIILKHYYDFSASSKYSSNASNRWHSMTNRTPTCSVSFPTPHDRLQAPTNTQSHVHSLVSCFYAIQIKISISSQRNWFTSEVHCSNPAPLTRWVSSIVTKDV